MIDISDFSFLGTSIPAGPHERRFSCPFCVERGKGEDKKHHLYLNPTRGLYVCFRCGAKGRVEGLLRRFGVEGGGRGLSGQTIDRIFADFLGGAGKEKSPVCPIPDVLAKMSDEALGYLARRGIDYYDAEHYEIMEGDGRMAGRIIVPEFLDKKLVCWVGRAFREGLEPRYRNAPGETRRGSVFNLERVQASGSDHVIITEGVFDAMAAGRRAVALYGKMCTSLQLSRLVNGGFSRYYVALDPDAPAENLDLCHRLYSWLPNPDVRLVRLPVGQDPSDLGREEFTKRVFAAEPYAPDRIDIWGALCR